LGYSSRQVYYKQKRQLKETEAEESKVLELVKTARLEMRRLGVRKVYLDIEEKLIAAGIKCGRDKLYSILRKHDMLIKPKKNYTKTTDSYHRYHKYKNEIKSLKIKEPEQVWVSDITYLRVGEQNVYLFLVTDAYSRKIMGWHLGYKMRVKDGLKALRMAMRNKVYEGKLIHHSDRGIQYCSTAYINYLERHDIQPSMTEDQHVYENSIAERVNGILKQEFDLDMRFMSITEARRVVKRSIKVYNEKRRHYSLHLVPPSFIHAHPIIEMKRWKSTRKYPKIA